MANNKSFLDVISRSVTSPSSSLGSFFSGQSFGLSDGSFWTQVFGFSSNSGKPVSVNGAMKLSAVWACVRLVSTSVAGLPFGVYEKTKDGGRISATDLSAYDVIHNSPNEDMTAFQFWQAIVASMLLWGNGYAEISWSSDGRGGVIPIALDFLLPSRIELKTDDKGRLRYFYRSVAGGLREINRKNMLHIPAFSLDGRIGLSAISYGVNIFGAAMSAEDAANGTFKNGLMPTTAFLVDRILKSDQRAEFRKYVETVSGAMNAGKSPVLEQGVKPEQIGINPADAQLLESRSFGIEEICRWFGVDPSMIGHGGKDSNWGTGLEQKQIWYLTFCISAFTNQIQQCVNKRLLTSIQRRKYYSEFSLEGFLKADSAARASFYSSMAQNGVYTRDDIRTKENLPRKGGNADVLTVQSNLLPLDQLGSNTPANDVRAALLNLLKDGED
ncbi:phage portal protein [Vibrio porteresiae]|uniref:Phage portal protein n=1 Tax=Vibrio porteresiae DSM 19223 TaxID=1123496 RepID=A0ABZ0QAH4_9VIBR|nr:phage portal protein [Vibrio porteresiae]WPC72930.1 phage portal protein [Vibrio porteresiae DSM 19223]